MSILLSRPVLGTARRASLGRSALFVVATAAGLGCGDLTDTADPGESPRAQGLLSVFPAVDSLPADGASSTTVTTTVTERAARSYPSLTISTNAGTLLGDAGAAASTVTASVSADERAKVTLVAPRTIGAGQVTARLGGEVTTTSVKFFRAYPDAIVLDVPRFTAAANLDSVITLQVRLVRFIGKPTEGARVTLSASQGGVFSGSSTTDANGELTVRFAVPPGATGDVTITASTRSSHSDSTKTVSASATVRVNP